MRKFYFLIIYILFLCSFQKTIAQDLKINRIDNIPDTSIFSNNINSTIYFQFASTTLTAPFTVYFNYSVNGIVQPFPLDSFVYTSPITTEISKNITIQTNSPVFRKGDNIVVVWPICNQVTHTANYFRKVLFVTDTLNTSIISNKNEVLNNWNIVFNQEMKQLQILQLNMMELPIQLKVYDLNGKQLYNEKMYRAESSSMQNMSTGVYIFELRNKNNIQKGRILIY